MSQNPDTIAQLKRQNQRLQARIIELEGAYDKQASVIREHIYDVVDAEMRIKQALAILTGNDE